MGVCFTLNDADGPARGTAAKLGWITSQVSGERFGKDWYLVVGKSWMGSVSAGIIICILTSWSESLKLWSSTYLRHGETLEKPNSVGDMARNYIKCTVTSTQFQYVRAMDLEW